MIPAHLAHLERWRGLPAPYINRRGAGETERDWYLRYDRNVGTIAAHMADQDGAPIDFTHQCIQRQRECVIRGLCQVCARPVAWPDRRLVLSSVSVESVEVEGRVVPVVTEPWLCPDCGDFALSTCPALIRRGRDEDLRLVTVTKPEDCRIVLSSGWIEGPYEAATKTNPVVMWAKVLLLNGAGTGCLGSRASDEGTATPSDLQASPSLGANPCPEGCGPVHGPGCSASEAYNRPAPEKPTQEDQ